MMLLLARGMDVTAIAKVAFTSEDPVRDVIRDFSAGGFGSLCSRYRGGGPPKFTLGQRREIKKIARSRPARHDLPFPAWSLARLAGFLVAEGVARRHRPRGAAHAAARGGRHLPAVKDWKTSADPQYAAKKARIEYLYAVAGRTMPPGRR